MKRQSGVLLPVFSLPGEYSCGSFGDEAAGDTLLTAEDLGDITPCDG